MYVFHFKKANDCICVKVYSDFLSECIPDWHCKANSASPFLFKTSPLAPVPLSAEEIAAQAAWCFQFPYITRLQWQEEVGRYWEIRVDKKH